MVKKDDEIPEFKADYSNLKKHQIEDLVNEALLYQNKHVQQAIIGEAQNHRNMLNEVKANYFKEHGAKDAEKEGHFLAGKTKMDKKEEAEKFLQHLVSEHYKLRGESKWAELAASSKEGMEAAVKMLLGKTEYGQRVGSDKLYQSLIGQMVAHEGSLEELEVQQSGQPKSSYLTLLEALGDNGSKTSRQYQNLQQHIGERYELIEEDKKSMQNMLNRELKNAVSGINYMSGFELDTSIGAGDVLSHLHKVRTTKYNNTNVVDLRPVVKNWESIVPEDMREIYKKGDVVRELRKY